MIVYLNENKIKWKLKNMRYDCDKKIVMKKFMDPSLTKFVDRQTYSDTGAGEIFGEARENFCSKYLYIKEEDCCVLIKRSATWIKILIMKIGFIHGTISYSFLDKPKGVLLVKRDIGKM